MRLERIRLRNFRNYRHLDLSLDGDFLLFVGANGQGKTNLLEAVGLLVTGRSPRASRYQDLIRWGEEEATVWARATRHDSPVEVEIRLRAGGRHGFFLQGKPVQRTSELLGEIQAVFFFPDDLQLVKGGPALRRRFLDLQLAQLKAAYRDRLIAYQRVLRQRNVLLAEGRGQGRFSGSRFLPGESLTERLAPWDEQLVRLGAYLMRERARAVLQLAPEAQKAYEAISGAAETLRLAYRPFWAQGEGESGTEEEGAPFSSQGWREEERGAGGGELDPEADEALWRERFWQVLEERRREEMARGLTLVGPQRDDVDLYLDQRPARVFASQGQQRSLVLALKAAEVQHLHRETGEPPLLLLDDVFSELDAGRRRRLLEAVGPRVQVFMTATGRDAYPDAVDHQGRPVRVFEIRAGTVTGKE